MSLSVIVPAYNAEKTLLKCVGSILKNNVVTEVIIVDDDSDDDTVNLVKGLTSDDNRVKFLKQENSGPFIARMNGLNHAVSDFVTFVDSDDFIEDGAYDLLFKFYNLSEYDVLEFGRFEISEDNRIIGGSKLKKKVYKGNCAKHFAEQNNTTNFLWNKIFKRKIFDGVQVLPLHYSEDACLLAQIYLKAEKCLVIPQKLYNYVINKDSLVHRSYNDKFFDNITGWKYIRSLYERNCPKLVKPIDLKLSSLAVGLYCKCPESEKEKYLSIFKEHRKNISFFTILRYSSFKRMGMILLFPRFKNFVERRFKNNKNHIN